MNTHATERGDTAHKLVASVPELEVGRGRSELVDELRDRIAQPCIFVALQVGLEVFLCVAFVDLRHASVHVVRASRQRSPTSAKGSSSSSSSPSYNSSQSRYPPSAHTRQNHQPKTYSTTEYSAAASALAVRTSRSPCRRHLRSPRRRPLHTFQSRSAAASPARARRSPSSHPRTTMSANERELKPGRWTQGRETQSGLETAASVCVKARGAAQSWAQERGTQDRPS